MMDCFWWRHNRTLIWLGLALLPVTSAVWVLSVLAASNTSEILFYAFSLCSVLESIFILLGYCLLNRRVRNGLLRLAGRKVIDDDPSSGADGVDGRRSTTSAGASRTQPASNLTYQNRDITLQRHMGISTSSTTSRSTCKTNSSHYRSDLRDVSTSTASRSSYDSRHVTKSPYAYDDDCSATKRRPSDSGGDSEGRRSLDLASSHTSDDDETNTTRSLSLNRNLKGEIELDQILLWNHNIYHSVIINYTVVCLLMIYIILWDFEMNWIDN